MHPQGVEAFPHYYVGINSLAELATKEDRVCVLNITGGESRTVTPVRHTRDIEALFAEYAAELPDDFKQRFPSLKTIYDQLSEDIHAANESSELFEQAKQQIKEHFNGKRHYKRR